MTKDAPIWYLSRVMHYAAPDNLQKATRRFTGEGRGCVDALLLI